MINSSILQKTKELRRRLHSIPEGALSENRTKEVLMTFLAEETELELHDRGSWFYALYKKEKEPEAEDGKYLPPVAFRADFDAVPLEGGGYAHLCGHDGHSAVLAGFGLLLEEIRPDRDVCLIFQCAEETGQGAALITGAETGIDWQSLSAVYAFHNIPGYPPGSILIRRGTFACASEGLELTLTGAASHAAYPANGRNPAAAIASLILGIQELLSRHDGKSVLLSTVIGISLGGEAYGVSPGSGTLRLTIRGEKADVYDSFRRSLLDLAEKLAEEGGLDLKVSVHDPFPSTENDPACLKKAEAAAENAGLACVYPDEPFRWSEDFGHFLRKCPGFMVGVGSGETCPGLHTAAYAFPDGLIEQVLTFYKELVRL